MRKVAKRAEPSVLIEKKAEWDKAIASDPSNYDKARYRHEEIKAALLVETSCKCVYCECKIGHNCPGDIEHKVPKRRVPALWFDWSNLTIACTECNRRKLEYYDPTCMFLDPYADDVESLVLHLGPLVFNVANHSRSEVTVRLLQLDDIKARSELVARKIEKLESIRHLAARWAAEENATNKQFLRKQLIEACEISSEYSGMVQAYLTNLDGLTEAP